MNAKVASILVRLLAAGALVLLLAPPLPISPPDPTPTATGQRYGRGQLNVERGRIRLRLAGTPYEMGYQQGVLLGPQIRWLLGDVVFPALMEQELDGPWLYQAARASARGWPSPLLEEAQGIADGAGITPAEVILLNMWPDLLTGGAEWRRNPPAWPLAAGLTANLAGRPAGRAVSFPVRRGLPAVAPGPWPSGAPEGRRPGAGFGLAAWGDATADGRPIVAGVLDAYPGAPQPLFVERRPERGLASLGVALPGWVGLTAGLNEAGLALLAVTSPSSDRRLDGMPTALQARQALERARTGEEALRLLVGAPRAGGAQVLVASGPEERAWSVELSARLFSVLAPERPWQLVTPLPVADTIRTPLPPAYEAHQRRVLGRVAAWLRWNEGHISPANLSTFLVQTGQEDEEAWVALLIWPADGVLRVAQPAGVEPAPASGFVSYALEEPKSRP